MQYAGKTLSNPWRRLGWWWAGRGLDLAQITGGTKEELALLREGYLKRIHWESRRQRG